MAGFSAPDANGRWVGFDVDLCRALSAAIFGDADRAKFLPVDSGEALTALRQGEVDILTRPNVWTIELERDADLAFAGVSFFDGEAVLVPKSMGIDSLLQLSGARICLRDQPRLREGLVAYFDQRRMRVEVKAFAHQAEVVAAYESHQCDAVAEDLSLMPQLRGALADTAGQTQLPALVAVHPLGPLVRRGDIAWRRIAHMTLTALIAAEQAGLDQSELRRAPADRSLAAAEFLAVAADAGPPLGLSNRWAEQVIGAVGNYGEMFERNLGPGSAAGLVRGLNNLWSGGGLMVAPDLR